MRQGVALPWDEARAYCGLDRLPWALNPLEVPDDDFGRAWREYEEAWEDGNVGRDEDLAGRLCHQLDNVGQDVELIYAHIVAQPTQVGRLTTEEAGIRTKRMEWFERRSLDVPMPVASYTSIGLDVCSPVPSFHSVIFQPGLGFPHDADFAAHLNQYGLIPDDSIGYAVALMDSVNQSGYLLNGFHVVRVLAPVPCLSE